MGKKRPSKQSAVVKRNLSIPDESWEPFVAFVQSLEIHQGSRTTHVTNSRAAEAAFRLFRCFGIDKARRIVFDKLNDESFWSRLEHELTRNPLPE